MKIDRLSRRALLGGAAAAVALPVLRSLVPRSARAHAATGRPRRVMAFYVPDGIHMADWTPAQTGASYPMPPILASLAPLRDRLLVLSGLDNRPGRPDQIGDHASGTGAYLTCTHVRKSETEIVAGISMDQVAANHFAATSPTRFPSLQLGTDGGSNGGNCDNGYSCAYIRNISWSGPSSPMPKMVSPRAVFELLFAGSDPAESAADAERRRAYKASVLDQVLDEADDVRRRLGHSDREKLDEYLTGVRELELRVQDPAALCPVTAAPAADPDFPTRTRQMLDLMALAVQCDLTRVMTFMIGNGGDNRAFPFLGISEGHHQLSHHQGNAANFPKLSKICAWEVEQLAYFLTRLDAIDDGEDRTALDNSLVFFSSEIEDGNSHAHTNLPVLVAGGGSGAMVTGQHLQFDRPLADLFITMLRSVGVSIDRFGDDGTGALPELLR
jgi:hypothetical protein